MTADHTVWRRAAGSRVMHAVPPGAQTPYRTWATICDRRVEASAESRCENEDGLGFPRLYRCSACVAALDRLARTPPADAGTKGAP